MNTKVQHSPIRLAILIVVLSVLRAIFSLSGGRWFYKNIVRGIISSASFLGSMKFLNLPGTNPMISSFLQSNNRNLQLVSRGCGAAFVTLSGILLHLTIGRAKQELFNHIETTSKKAIVSQLLSEQSFGNPYNRKFNSFATATMLHDTVSQFGKACVLTAESSGFLCGSMMASSAMTTSIFSDLVPSLLDWQIVDGFMRRVDPKRAGLELVKLFGFVEFVNVIPVSHKLKYGGLKPSKMNMNLIASTASSQNTNNDQQSSSSSSRTSSSSSSKVNRWLPLVAEALRQSQVLSSNICVTDKEREVFAHTILKRAGLADPPPSTKLLQQIEEQKRRLVSSSSKKRAAAAVAIANLKKEIEQQNVSLLDLFKPPTTSSLSKSSSSSSNTISQMFKNPISLAIMVANSIIGLDAGLIASSSWTVFNNITTNTNSSDSGNVTLVGGGCHNWDKHSTAILQWISIVQSSLSIFACAADIGKVSARLSPLLVRPSLRQEIENQLSSNHSSSSNNQRSKTNKKPSVNLSSSSSSSSSSEDDDTNTITNRSLTTNTRTILPSCGLQSELAASPSAPNQVGYVSLHRQEAKLVGKVTVVESQLFTGNDAAATNGNNNTTASGSASLENSLSEASAMMTLANSSSSSSQPIPTLTNSCSLPFHLYPGAGLLVATETSRIGEMFISSIVSSIQSSFSSSSSSSSNSSSFVEIITSDPLIVPGLSLADQITFPRKAREIDTIGEWDIFNLLSAAGLESLVQDDPGNQNLPVCSGAANESIRKVCEMNLTLTQRQQLAVARVLFRKPRYVILWNCLFPSSSSSSSHHSSRSPSPSSSENIHSSQPSASSPIEHFKEITEAFKKAGITVVSVFTCANILDWSIRRSVMSCHFNGLFLRDDNIFLHHQEQQQQTQRSQSENNQNSQQLHYSSLKRTNSNSSIDSSATVPLGFGGDYCSAAFGILQNPPPMQMFNFSSSNLMVRNKNEGTNTNDDSVVEEVPSFSPETFLSFSRILSRSTVVNNNLQ